MLGGRGRIVLLAVAVAALVIGGLTAADHIWVSGPARVETLRLAFEQVLGAKVRINGPVEIAVLPKPRFVIHDVDVTTSDGASSLRIPTAKLVLALLPILNGHVVVDRLQLYDPTGVLDADALIADLRARQTRPVPPLDADDGMVPARLVVTAGILQFRSSKPVGSGLMTDLHADVEGLRTGAISVAGGAAWRGGRGDFSARLDSLEGFLSGQRTACSFKLRSAVATASAAGVLANGWRGGWVGTAAASTPSLPLLLKSIGVPFAAAASIHHASFTGTAETDASGVSVSDAKLVLNNTALEGAFGWQYQNGKPGLVGTLATDVLDLDPFVDALPRLRDDAGGWSERSLGEGSIGAENLDLRISANRIVVRGIEAEDAALSALAHDGRLEVSLGEVRAYGGLVKGRLSSSDTATGVDIKLDTAWSRVDLGEIPQTAILGSGRIFGTSTGHVTLASHGRSVRETIENSVGRGQISLKQGKVVGVPVVQTLLHAEVGGTAPIDDGAEKIVDLAEMDFTVTQGTVTLGRSLLSGPNLQMRVSGGASLPTGAYAFSAVPVVPFPQEGPEESTTSVAGEWGGAMRRVQSIGPDWVGARATPRQDGYDQ